MWVVFDAYFTRIYGPFDSIERAQDWLNEQGIGIGQYADQEVAIERVLDPSTQRLEQVP